MLILVRERDRREVCLDRHSRLDFICPERSKAVQLKARRRKEGGAHGARGERASPQAASRQSVRNLTKRVIWRV